MLLVWLVRMLPSRVICVQSLILFPGFSYKFDALGQAEHPSELLSALKTIFNNTGGGKIDWVPMLQAFVPPLRIIVSTPSPSRLVLHDEYAPLVLSPLRVASG